MQKGDVKILSEVLEVFRLCPSFSHLGENELREIAVLATPCHFKKGQFIFHEGDPSNLFYVVQRGRVKLFRTRSGKNFIASVVSRGYTLNASALFERQAYFLSAQAMDDVTLLRVRGEDYRSFVKKYPSIAMKIISILTKRMESDLDRIVDVVGERVDQRLHNVLLMLFARFGTTLLFTCEELADLAGTTTETTIRALGKLKDLGILSSTRGKITILDQNKLRDLSQTSYQL